MTDIDLAGSRLSISRYREDRRILNNRDPPITTEACGAQMKLLGANHETGEFGEDAGRNTAAARVVVVCGEQIMRSGLVSILRGMPDLGWVGPATNSQAALNMVAAGKADVVVLDHCANPGWDGPALAARFTGIRPDRGVGVVVVSDGTDSELLLRYLQAGVRGLVSRRSSAVDLVNAVDSVIRGEALLSPSITRLVLEATVPYLPAASTRSVTALDTLTQRELEILILVADGLSNSEIAQVLHVSYKTVKFHVSNILRKLSVRTRAQAIVYLRPSVAITSQAG
ncbi:response regulator transcription factor [Nocardia sp. SC052]|uniref:response regulator transcription factor n=1 Tax=Nocardia sichangensis TaxID=3385975 RepID=UPI0039A06122